MNQRVLPSILLSLLIVFAFALVLHPRGGQESGPAQGLGLTEGPSVAAPPSALVAAADAEPQPHGDGPGPSRAQGEKNGSPAAAASPPADSKAVVEVDWERPVPRRPLPGSSGELIPGSDDGGLDRPAAVGNRRRDSEGQGAEQAGATATLRGSGGFSVTGSEAAVGSRFKERSGKR